MILSQLAFLVPQISNEDSIFLVMMSCQPRVSRRRDPNSCKDIPSLALGAEAV
jgi:hypothetical protein